VRFPRGSGKGTACSDISGDRLADDLNARPENVNLDELLESIKAESTKLAPLIGMEARTAGVENRGAA
jgi:hypothetical protein